MTTHYQVHCGESKTKRMTPRKFAIWVKGAVAEGRKVSLEYNREYHTYWGIIEEASL